MLIARTVGPQPREATPLTPENTHVMTQAPELLWAMDTFAELVEAAGPLCHLRFDAFAFSACAAELEPFFRDTPHAREQANTVERTEGAIEQVYLAHGAHLYTQTFARQMDKALADFERLPYIDASHRLAVQTARALMPDRANRPVVASTLSAQAPALYAIFRAQVMQHFGLDGDGQPVS